MKALHHAILAANRAGIPDFQAMLEDHLRDGFVWCSPDSFICAMESWREFGDSHVEPAWFITLAVGDIGQFVRMDPKPDGKKWIGFCREEGGDVHWIDYQRLRKRFFS